MTGCKEMEALLTGYLDGELSPQEAAVFQAHLEVCPACAARHENGLAVEDLVRSALAPAGGEASREAFVRRVRDRLEEGARPGLSLQRLCAALAAAAAAVLLVWAFSALHVKRDRLPAGSSREDVASTDGKDREGPPRVDVAVTAEERMLAQEALRSILADLDAAPDEVLPTRFAQATSDLRDGGWKAENMLAGVLDRGEGAGLRTAIRLAGLLEGFEKVPGAAYSLSRLLDRGICPVETMRSLAVLDGTRAEEALGRALLKPELRDAALASLAGMRGGNPAPRIERALVQGKAFAGEALSPFARSALQALSRMGPEGVKSVISLYRESGYHPALVRALSPPEPAFGGSLAAQLDHELRGPAFRTGLRLAAALRMVEAVHLARSGREEAFLEQEGPSLIALVGGPLAVVELAALYQEPVSLRQRERAAAALAAVFHRHPVEMDATLKDGLDVLDETGREVLIEMLTRAGTGAACRALAWMVEHRPGLAPSASLGLARTNAPEALELLLTMLERGELAGESRVAAAAAALHLGGEAALAKIQGEAEAGAYARTRTGYQTRRRSLTDSRFEKLQEYIVNRSEGSD